MQTHEVCTVFVMDVPSYPRMLLITDAAINIYPKREEKADIVQNAIDLAHVLGIEQPVLVDSGVMAALEAFVPLAPLHQPHSLGAIQSVAERAPGLPQVACFDTAFHRRQPAVAQAFGLPSRFTDEGILRYGFHGLGHSHK